MINRKNLLTISEVAKRLMVCHTKAYEICHSEGFPLIKFGHRQFRVEEPALEQWIDDHDIY